MIIHINEQIFDKLFLTESKNSKRAHVQTRKIFADFYQTSVDDPEVIEAQQWLEKKFFGEGLRQDWFIVLEPNIAMWYIDGEGMNEQEIQKYVGYLYRKGTTFEKPSEFIAQVRHIKTLDDIRSFVNEQMENDQNEENEKMSSVNGTFNKNYQILGPISFEEANEYGNYSNPNGKICYTQDEGTWKSSNYSNRNRNCCYLILRNDWETVKPEHDGSELNNGLDENLNKHDAYDNYGLSMIFLFVDNKGRLHECNTRWNHDAHYAPGRSVDFALTEYDISKLIGAPFNEVFKYNKEYDEMLKQRFEKIKDALSKSESISFQLLNDLFDSYTRNDKDTYVVEVDGIYNILNRNTLTFMLGEWCSRISGSFDVSKVITIENLNGKCNYLRNDYKILSDVWFDDVQMFSDTYGIVQLDNTYNIIDINGNMYIKDGASYIGTACVGNRKVVLKVEKDNGKMIFFDATNLEFIGDRWFDGVGIIGPYEYCPVKWDGKYNFININGEYLLDKWVTNIARCSPSCKDGWLIYTHGDAVRHVSLSGKVEPRAASNFIYYILSHKPYGTLR